MKTKYIIVAIIIAVFSFGGCTKKEYFDYKATVVPLSNSSVITPNDMNRAAEIISKRLNNSFGILQESMKLDVTENQISLTISKADTGKIASVKKIIADYGRLEFRETYENPEIIGYLSRANNLLKDASKTEGSATTEEFKKQNPLLAILKPMTNEGGDPLPSCMIGVVNEKDTSEVNTYLKMTRVKALFPNDIKFYWGAKPYKYDPSKSSYGLYAIKVTTQDGIAPLDGNAVTSAKTVAGSSGAGVIIDLTMSGEGASTWARITHDNINRCIAIIYNGYVRSYPRVQSEISGGDTEITGDFTVEEANDLVNILKSGQMPFELKIIDEQIVKEINSR